eukprot:TRINITY_DN15967_c0_g1_i1.p1 TRINITY_DN15967_c0_g1~~TRINITY_DN15967_c0_g1_i1.p1  ORF type:complete len:162 (-),score=37.84 TRINITY_DN15967_c0_g1_i1:87-545(-)
MTIGTRATTTTIDLLLRNSRSCQWLPTPIRACYGQTPLILSRYLSTNSNSSDNKDNSSNQTNTTTTASPSSNIVQGLQGKNPTRERVEMAKPTPEELERIEQRRAASMEKVKQKELEQEPYVNPETGEIGGPRGPEPTRYGDWGFKGRISDF